MRRIVKGAQPVYLQENSQRLTSDYLLDRSKAPYNHDAIKGALRDETFGKCAYCESPLASSNAYGAVEHIKPKRHFPELIVEWSNLTWACPVCNTNKGDYFSEDAPIVDPTQQDPAEVLEFQGPFVSARFGSTIGEVTLVKLRLRREQLIIERSRAIEALDGLLQRWARESSADFKDVLRESILEGIAPERPFSATLREFARIRGFDLLPASSTSEA